MTPYREFLASKRLAASPAGFEPTGPIHPTLFAWQAECVRWALRRGRAALFEAPGLGKTFQQLEWGRQVHAHIGRDVLILAPLSVGPQTVREGLKLDLTVHPCRTQADVRPGVNVTNYEMLKHFNPDHFAGVVLDESSLLKSFTGKTKRALVEAFAGTPYKLACTATPAPNDHMELTNHAEFLEVEGAHEMLARFFINDAGNAGVYRLKKHAERDFWRWVASWAISLTVPSDLGYPDDGFILPGLVVTDHVVAVDRTADAGGLLFRMPELNATGLHKELRMTTRERAAKVAEIVATDPGAWAVWCTTNYAADALKAAIPEAIEVRGSESIESKEAKLDGFVAGRHRILIAKPKQCGFGLNWQHCHNHVFADRSYSFEQEYQAICRSLRFGQEHVVNVHFVAAETETPIGDVVRRKHQEHQAMKKAMVRAVAEDGLGKAGPRPLTATTEDMAAGSGWTLHLGDVCETIRRVESGTVGLTVTSPPFEDLYVYSDREADLGNSAGSAEFFAHFGYLIPELLRVTIPGRLAVVHCKDLPLYRGRDGECGLRDFPGAIVRAFEGHGWTYHSRVTIWKCPVTERERTNNNGLLHKTLCRDSSQVRQGMADFLVAFRKPPGDAGNLSAEPIVRPDGLTEYIGDPALDPRTSDEHPSPYSRKLHSLRPSIDIWRRLAEPVWWDIDQTRVLNFRIARSERDEKHICPLQLDVIARCIQLWSNPGDLVLDPFSGVGSTGHEAIRLRRRYVGVELNPAYWEQAAVFLGQAEEQAGQRTLFDLSEVG